MSDIATTLPVGVRLMSKLPAAAYFNPDQCVAAASIAHIADGGLSNNSQSLGYPYCR
jgi:hypothetical protein